MLPTHFQIVRTQAAYFTAARPARRCGPRRVIMLNDEGINEQYKNKQTKTKIMASRPRPRPQDQDRGHNTKTTTSAPSPRP